MTLNEFNMQSIRGLIAKLTVILVLLSASSDVLFAQVTTVKVCYGTVPPSLLDDNPITGGVGPFGYLWQESTDNVNWTTASGVNNSTSYVPIDAITDTTYFRRLVIDQNCDDTSFSNVVVFEVTDPISSNASATAITCNGDTDGAISLAVVGGGAPYVFNWSTGDTTVSVDSLTAGNYIVTITDTSGCQLVDTVVVADKDPLLTSLSVTDATCEEGNDGEIVANATGGNGGYNFAWSNGSSGNLLNNLNADSSYSVTVTDAEGCLTVDTASVGFINPLPLVDLGNDTAYGVPSLITLSTGISGSHLWSTGATTDSLTFEMLSDTTIWVVVEDVNGCSNSDTIKLEGLLGLEGKDDIVALKLYPNPTNGLLNITSSNLQTDIVTVQVLDISGKLLLSREYRTIGLHFDATLDLSNQSQGAYYININAGNKRFTEQIQLY
jgi:hypothetical protein